jgi:hypothetical protein
MCHAISRIQDYPCRPSARVPIVPARDENENVEKTSASVGPDAQGRWVYRSQTQDSLDASEQRWDIELLEEDLSRYVPVRSGIQGCFR